MAYENFIPTLWAEGIERDLERLCVFTQFCNRKYEGKVAEKGDTVRILGVGKPTIYDMDRKNASGLIVDPEEVADSSIPLTVKQIRYFNFKVGDIDKAQAVKGLMDALRAEASEGLANAMDKFVAAFAVDPTVEAMYETPLKMTADKAGSGELNVLHALDAAAQKLYENDVKSTTEIEAIVTPRFATLFRRAYIDKDTNNHEEMKNGYIGKYGNIIVRVSNNVHQTQDGAVDNIMVRTKRAIAFVNPLTHVEAYRPEKMFADAIKGFELFDGVVARPKEIVNLNVTY